VGSLRCGPPAKRLPHSISCRHRSSCEASVEQTAFELPWETSSGSVCPQVTFSHKPWRHARTLRCVNKRRAPHVTSSIVFAPHCLTSSARGRQDRRGLSDTGQLCFTYIARDTTTRIPPRPSPLPARSSRTTLRGRTAPTRNATRGAAQVPILQIYDYH
jgi:hypothetical protein